MPRPRPAPKGPATVWYARGVKSHLLRATAVAALAVAGVPLFFFGSDARAQAGKLPTLPSGSVSAAATAPGSASAAASGAAAPNASASASASAPASASVSAPPPVPPPPAGDWQSRYDAAGRRMTAGDFLTAIQEYSALAATAPNETARNLALEQLRIASDYAAKNTQSVPPSGALPPPTSGAPSEGPPPGYGGWVAPPKREPDRTRRTTDELVFLYIATPAYGFTTGFWLDALITGSDGYRDTATAGSIFIGLGATGLSALAVALVDNAKGFKYGMPQAIFTGYTVGFGAGLGMAVWAGNRASTSFSTYRKFTSYTWGFSTAGAALGAVLGATVPTTPGRSAWVGTTAMVAGLTVGGIAGAATPSENNGNDVNARNFGITSAIAGLGGVGIGLLTAPLLSPSISRVRFMDLGWLSGGALALGFCAAYGNNGCSERAAFGTLAIGASVGFGIGLLATIAMPPDKLGESKEGKKESFLDRMMPTVAPTEGGGVSVGLAGPW